MRINDFLDSLSLPIDAAGHCTVADSDIEPADNLITPLTYYGFLATLGPDSSKFLQGQTTCNVSEVNAMQSRLGAYCTPKGRMLSSFRLGYINSEYYLLKMRRELVPSTQERLAKYIVFSKATQRDASEDYLAIGLSGPLAASRIEACFGDRPTGTNQQLVVQDNLVIQWDTAGQLFECWLTAAALGNLWPRLSEGLTLQGSRSWELLMIRQGWGDVCAATTDLFIPQMLNYQTIGAISFNKGCYTGQEVVARMHYKGAIKRRMYRVRIANPSISPGTPLYRPDGEQSIGEVVNSVGLDDNHSEALAVITIKDAGEQAVQCGPNRDPVELLSLPYAIT